MAVTSCFQDTFAGIENSSSTVEWIMTEIFGKPDVHKKVTGEDILFSDTVSDLCYRTETLLQNFFSSSSLTQARGGGRLQRQLPPAAVGRLQSSSSKPCDHKNPSLFRCNNLDFLVSAFHAVVFSDNAEALPTRGDDDCKESLRRLAAWHDGSAKPAVIPFSGSGDDGLGGTCWDRKRNFLSVWNLI
ncbi:hypothetical protein MRB53_030090 [Persea americana]|uniref:Uncharacterized protein n=1 Tax=Persea americana TaxID=3435 RepID=A0ACC2KKI1_PERAE|nr:hypothetical protein MRB53_030090 [Persea americana]